MAKTSKINIILSAVDKMSFVIDKAVNNGIKKFDTMRKKSDRLAKSSAAFAQKTGTMGVAMAASLAVPVKLATDFEKSMANISTLIDTSTESMQKMNSDVLQIAQKLPVSVMDLSSALYDVRSAGIVASDAMSVLESSAQLSVAGLSTTKEATNIMTSAINAFSAEGLKASEISDILFKTVKAGKTDIAKLSESFGANAGTIAAANVKLADFQAATAALTTVGMPASQAQNRLRAVIDSLNKPSSDMQKIFDSLGIKTTSELIEKTGSLGGAMKLVSKTAKDLNVNISKALGSSEAYGAVISLTGEQNKAYTETLAFMTNGTSELGKALAKQTETFSAKQQILNNKLSVMAIKIGNALMPMLIKLANAFMPIVDAISNWVEKNPNLTTGIVSVVAAIAGLLTVLSGAGFMVSGITSFFSTMTTLGPLVMKAFGMVSMGIRSIGAALMANPILLIIAAIALAAYLIYDNWDAISAWFSEKWEQVKVIFNQFLDWWDQVDLYDTGIEILTGLWEGLKATHMKVVEYVKEIGEDISKSFKAVLGIESPSKVFIEHGEDIAKGAEIGMTQGAAAANMGAAGGNIIAGEANSAIPAGGNSGVSGMSLVYSPTINLTGGESKIDFEKMLREHAQEMVRVIEEYTGRQNRLAF